MRYEPEKVKMKEIVSGFTERDIDSKALLNTDIESLLKYKIQRKKFVGSQEVEKMKTEMEELKSELSEIKALLLTIAKSNQQ